MSLPRRIFVFALAGSTLLLSIPLAMMQPSVLSIALPTGLAVLMILVGDTLPIFPKNRK